MEVVYLEPNVFDLHSPVTICGDTHGHLSELFELFNHCTPKDSTTFLFLGDYVDRGHNSSETLFYLLALKLKYPTHFCLLRGAHEGRDINRQYGFYVESEKRYGHSGVWSLCNDLFAILPYTALIDNRVFCVHSGLSPSLSAVEHLSLVNRQGEARGPSLFWDLCWCDPEDLGPGVAFRSQMRGWSYLFGEQTTKRFLHWNRLKFMVRSHQVVMQGYSWMFDRKLLSIWSVPNYAYTSGNLAALMRYEAALGADSEIVVFNERKAEKV
jgi:diadenosine tetraphosphatase ApaH/serine/threonine PP2A family protein phosphatase